MGQEGILGCDTDYFMDGSPVTIFSKIQFSGWSAKSNRQYTSDELFNEVIADYFKGECTPYCSHGCKRVHLFHVDQIFSIGDITLQVDATEPSSGLGVITSQAEIFAQWDATPALDKIHIVPFEDTLPRAYQYTFSMTT